MLAAPPARRRGRAAGRDRRGLWRRSRWSRASRWCSPSSPRSRAARRAAAITDALRVLLRMMVAVGGAGAGPPRCMRARARRSGGAAPDRRCALARLWSVDLCVFARALSAGTLADRDARSPCAASRWSLVALVIGVARQRRDDDWTLQVSRTVAFRSLSLVAIGAYVALLALADQRDRRGRRRALRALLQTAFVFGSTAALLTLVVHALAARLGEGQARQASLPPPLRLSRRMAALHRDARRARAAPPPLDERIVKAIADLTDSPGRPAARARTASGLGAGAAWNWDARRRRRRRCRARRASRRDRAHRRARRAARRRRRPRARAVPQWMLDARDAWAVVPLPHLGRLAGAIAARAPAGRPRARLGGFRPARASPAARSRAISPRRARRRRSPRRSASTSSTAASPSSCTTSRIWSAS